MANKGPMHASKRTKARIPSTKLAMARPEVLGLLPTTGGGVPFIIVPFGQVDSMMFPSCWGFNGIRTACVLFKPLHSRNHYTEPGAKVESAGFRGNRRWRFSCWQTGSAFVVTLYETHFRSCHSVPGTAGRQGGTNQSRRSHPRRAAGGHQF